MYTEFDRATWRKLRKSMPQVLSPEEVEQLRGIGECLNVDEVEEVYLPLSRLIYLRYRAHQELIRAQREFLDRPLPKFPFIIGIAGSVAVGKSTTARVLQVLLQRWENKPTVDLVTTDGFLYPTEELRRRGILGRKGFPESYDQRALLTFMDEVKSGDPHVHAPVYSHIIYDRVPDAFIDVNQPDIMILEGLNVLQTGPDLMVSDFFDFSIYVDAPTNHIEQWYVDRFLELRTTHFNNPESHFRTYADLDDAAAIAVAHQIWATVNLPNLLMNILPTKKRADLILHKSADHTINQVSMRHL
ncbi:MAG: type I pantothenate kinase [Corynebacterium sp.]|nr:type I pantothenate kinase [Corynebacterium sp.]